jgi:hypothetical protein
MSQHATVAVFKLLLSFNFVFVCFFMFFKFGCLLFVFADIMSDLCNPSIGYLWLSPNSVQCDVLFKYGEIFLTYEHM